MNDEERFESILGHEDNADLRRTFAAAESVMSDDPDDCVGYEDDDGDVIRAAYLEGDCEGCGEREFALAVDVNGETVLLPPGALQPIAEWLMGRLEKMRRRAEEDEG